MKKQINTIALLIMFIVATPSARVFAQADDVPDDPTTAMTIESGDAITDMDDPNSDVGNTAFAQAMANTFWSVSAPDTEGYNVFVAGDKGNILRTTDGGAHWTPQNSGTSETLYGISSSNGIAIDTAVGSIGIILGTTDGGAHWTPQTSGTSNTLYGVYNTADSRYRAAVGAYGTILYTNNGGATWINQTLSALNSPHLYGVYFVNSSVGAVVGAKGTILHTTNGGTNWTRQTSGVSIDLHGVSFGINGSIGTAVGANGTILRTINGGANWTPQTSGTLNDLYGVFIGMNSNTVTVVGANGTILRTTDGGAHWTPQTSPSGLTLRAVAFPLINQFSTCFGAAVGNGEVILRTTDCTNWTRVH